MIVEIKDINVKKSAKMERISGSIWIDHKKLADFRNNIKKQYGFRLVEGANSEMYNGFLEIMNASLPGQPVSKQFTHYIHAVVGTYRDLERTINDGSLKAPSDQNLLLIQTDVAPLQKFPLPYPLWAIQATDLGISYLQAYFVEKVIPKISKAKEIDTFGVSPELMDMLFNATIGNRRLAASVFIQMMNKEAKGRHPFIETITRQMELLCKKGYIANTEAAKKDFVDQMTKQLDEAEGNFAGPWFYSTYTSSTALPNGELEHTITLTFDRSNYESEIYSILYKHGSYAERFSVVDPADIYTVEQVVQNLDHLKSTDLKTHLRVMSADDLPVQKKPQAAPEKGKQKRKGR